MRGVAIIVVIWVLAFGFLIACSRQSDMAALEGRVAALEDKAAQCEVAVLQQFNEVKALEEVMERLRDDFNGRRK